PGRVSAICFSCRRRHTRSNRDLSSDVCSSYLIDSNDEWITQRTGIHQRHFAFENETVSDLAIQSAKNLLKQLDAEIVQEIHLILVATMSSCLPTPSVASQVQRGLGIKQALAFDIIGAC